MKLLNFPHDASLVRFSNYELYDGIALTTLTPLEDEPTDTFKIKATVSGGTSNTGSITITGSLSGTSKTETLTFSNSGSKSGSNTYDTISSITTSGFTNEATVPNIKIECLNSSGQKILLETLTALKVRWESTTKAFLNSSGVYTQCAAFAMVVYSDINLGDTIRYQSRDYKVNQIEAYPLLNGNELYRILYF